MRIQWMTPRDGDYVSKSADGYYAVRRGGDGYLADYIEAVWARPMAIGTATTLSLAQQHCEQHRETAMKAHEIHARDEAGEPA